MSLKFNDMKKALADIEEDDEVLYMLSLLTIVKVFLSKHNCKYGHKFDVEGVLVAPYCEECFCVVWINRVINTLKNLPLNLS